MANLSANGLSLAPADVSLKTLAVSLLGLGPNEGSGVNLKPSFNGQLNLNLSSNSGNVPPSTALTVTRAGTAFVQNTSGQFDTVGANTLRIGADENLWQNAGVWIEELATSGVTSPDFSGAVAGVLGSGGALPTGWSRSSIDGAGLTITIGVAPFSLRFQGTGNGQFSVVQTSAGAGVAATAGDVWNGSFMAQLIAGSTSGFTQFGPYVVEYNAGAFATYSINQIQQFQTDIPWFAQTSATLAAGATKTVQMSIGFQTTNAAPIDATFVFQRPMLSKQAYRSTFANGTRNADVVSLATTYQTAYLGSALRSVAIGFDAPRFVPAGTLWSEQKDANNYIELRTTGSQGGNTLSLFVQSAGVTIANQVVGYLPPLSRNVVCMAIGATSILVSVNHDPVITVAITPPAGMTSTLLGSGNNGYINSTVQTLKTWLRALSSAEVLANSAVGGLFDDFARANSGSLGTAPTGQSWSQTGLPVYTITGNFMTTDLTNGATYGLINLGKNPVYMGSMQTFSNQAGNGSGALVAADSVPTPSVSNGVHMVNTSTEGDWDSLILGTVNVLAQFGYPTAVVKDGATLSGYAWFLRSDNSIIQIGPGGESVRFVSPTIAALVGPVLWYEAAGGGTNTVASFKAVSAR